MSHSLYVLWNCLIFFKVNSINLMLFHMQFFSGFIHASAVLLCSLSCCMINVFRVMDQWSWNNQTVTPHYTLFTVRHGWEEALKKKKKRDLEFINLRCRKCFYERLVDMVTSDKQLYFPVFCEWFTHEDGFYKVQEISRCVTQVY